MAGLAARDPKCSGASLGSVEGKRVVMSVWCEKARTYWPAASAASIWPSAHWNWASSSDPSAQTTTPHSWVTVSSTTNRNPGAGEYE